MYPNMCIDRRRAMSGTSVMLESCSQQDSGTQIFVHGHYDRRLQCDNLCLHGLAEIGSSLRYSVCRLFSNVERNHVRKSETFVGVHEKEMVFFVRPLLDPIINDVRFC